MLAEKETRLPTGPAVRAVRGHGRRAGLVRQHKAYDGQRRGRDEVRSERDRPVGQPDGGGRGPAILCADR